jgi:hypothetical protein
MSEEAQYLALLTLIDTFGTGQSAGEGELPNHPTVAPKTRPST